MEKIRPSNYIILPSNVRYDEELTPFERILYGEIVALIGKDGVCWATNSYFSYLYNVKPESVSRWLKHLQERGYIKNIIKYHKGRKRRVITLNNNGNDDLTFMSKDINKNAKYNNKKNNINRIFEEVRIKNEF